jgi:hypothetical protein
MNMRTVGVLVLLLGGCGGGEPEDPPDPVSSTLTVQLHWSWVYTAGTTCDMGVSQCNGCGAAGCISGCSGTLNTSYIQNCCNATRVVYASNRTQLLGDYARCAVTEPLLGVLDINCAIDGTTPVYEGPMNALDLVSGTLYKYTGGSSCTWGGPYTGP